MKPTIYSSQISQSPHRPILRSSIAGVQQSQDWFERPIFAQEKQLLLRKFKKQIQQKPIVDVTFRVELPGFHNANQKIGRLLPTRVHQPPVFRLIAEHVGQDT